MRRTFLLAATLAAAAVLTATPTAHAQTADESATGGRPTTSENSIRGRGQVDTAATANAAGALDVSASATAGRPLLGLLGGRSTAAATADVSNTFAVDEGTYTVTFTYDDTVATRSAEGGAAASVIANSVATFTSADETDQTPRPTIDFTEVEQDGGDLVVTLRVAVPEAGSLFTVNRLTVSADSTRAGADAAASASTAGTSVSLVETG